MTFTVAILVLTFFASIWLAADLLGPGLHRLLRSRSAAIDASHNAVSYEPVSRLLADGDFAYLADEKDLAERLLEMRTATMRLYLHRIRRDYLEVWNICRLLAPISPDPAFASRLSRQYWSFHWAYAHLWMQCLAPSVGRQASAADRLVQTLTEIREHAHSLLSVAEPVAVAAAA